ncbi:hypothetical protein GCM10022293_31760 [Azospirillum formosense]
MDGEVVVLGTVGLTAVPPDWATAEPAIRARADAAAIKTVRILISPSGGGALWPGALLAGVRSGALQRDRPPFAHPQQDARPIVATKSDGSFRSFGEPPAVRFSVRPHPDADAGGFRGSRAPCGTGRRQKS